MIRAIALVLLLAAPVAGGMTEVKKKNLPKVSIADFYKNGCAYRPCP